MNRTSPTHRPFDHLTRAFTEGRATRRQFVEGASALGMAIGTALALADAIEAQNATPIASPSQTVSSRPATGTDSQERGGGGDLRFLIWQAPTHLSPHTATGVKDTTAGTLMLEPLMHYLPDTSLAANLVTQVPTVDNGLLAADLSSVTYTLIPGVTWSDGAPFTAKDVVFTWNWVMDPANSATTIGNYNVITSAEALDDLTVKLSFKGPNPFWSLPFVGSTVGHVYPEHILGSGGMSIAEFQVKPIGTGPFVVDDFRPNDGGTFIANERYREPTKPWFSRVIMTGGGDPASAARAAIQTGEVDYAWGLSVEPEILRSMASDSSPGTFVVGRGGSVEAIHFNFSDPNQEVDGQRSEMNTPHPILSAPEVRKAMIAAIDRQAISDNFYLGGEQEPAVSNYISGIPGIDSPNTMLGHDPEAAKRLLDQAGWVLDGDVRKKDGVELKLRYATSISQLRQKIQAVVKANLVDVGFRIDLAQVDAAVFFDSGAGNDQNYPHFYYDIEMFTLPYPAPRPINSFQPWYSGENRSNIAQKANGWAGRNFTRYQNADFDAGVDALREETDVEAFLQGFIDLNDMLYDDAAVIPLIRAVGKSGVSKRLNIANLGLSQFNYDTWNIANWNEAPNE